MKEGRDPFRLWVPAGVYPRAGQRPDPGAAMDEEEIPETTPANAAAFFVGVNVVKQRLRLAAVSEKLLDICAEDGLSLEQLMAFTVTNEHARQEQIWESLQRPYSQEPYQVRRMLTEKTVRACRHRHLRERGRCRDARSLSARRWRMAEECRADRQLGRREAKGRRREDRRRNPQQGDEKGRARLSGLCAGGCLLWSILVGLSAGWLQHRAGSVSSDVVLFCCIVDGGILAGSGLL